MVLGELGRRIQKRTEYGPVKELSEYSENPVFYRQCIQEMEDVSGYIAPGDISAVERAVYGDETERLEEHVNGEEAYEWLEDTISEMSGVSDPFSTIDFTVERREQDGQRYIRMTGLHSQTFFTADSYEVVLEGGL